MPDYKLGTSKTQAIWRDKAIDIAYPAPPVTPDKLTDEIAIQIVARAKRRFDMTMKPGTTADTSALEKYTKAVKEKPQDLKGFCFVAADEFALYYTPQKLEAKAVRVEPTSSGGDHYFTVIKKGSKKDSIIIDGTWLQFFTGSGKPPAFCLVGTLAQVKSKLGTATTSIKLLDAYEAGLAAVDQWSKYTCFPK